MDMIPVLVAVGSMVVFGALLRIWLRTPAAARIVSRRGPWSAAQWRLWMVTIIVLLCTLLIGGVLLYLDVGP